MQQPPKHPPSVNNATRAVNAELMFVSAGRKKVKFPFKGNLKETNFFLSLPMLVLVFARVAYSAVHVFAVSIQLKRNAKGSQTMETISTPICHVIPFVIRHKKNNVLARTYCTAPFQSPFFCAFSYSCECCVYVYQRSCTRNATTLPGLLLQKGAYQTSDELSFLKTFTTIHLHGH